MTEERWIPVADYAYFRLWTNGFWKETFPYGIDPNRKPDSVTKLRYQTPPGSRNKRGPE